MSATDTIILTKEILDTFNLYHTLIFALIFVAIVLILKNL